MRCKNDRDLVLATVKQNGRSLQYASEACRDDKDAALTGGAAKP